MLELAVADVLLSGATTLVYIGALVFFVAWLKKKRVVRSGTSILDSH